MYLYSDVYSAQMRETQAGNASEVTFFMLNAAFSRNDLLKLLIDKGL